jgi:hypothetical protein
VAIGTLKKPPAGRRRHETAYGKIDFQLHGLRGRLKEAELVKWNRS